MKKVTVTIQRDRRSDYRIKTIRGASRIAIDKGSPTTTKLKFFEVGDGVTQREADLLAETMFGVDGVTIEDSELVVIDA